MSELASEPNPDLAVGRDNQEHMSQPDYRRHGFHNRYRLSRYSTSFRAGRVLLLRKNMDPRIAQMQAVRQLCSLPWFSAMVIVRGSEVLFERYASDFGPAHPHIIQSVSKTMMNLVIGRLAEEGSVDLSRRIDAYLPWIGSGYADATVQQVLDMDVTNDYSEDYRDPEASCYAHKEAYGWRLPPDSGRELTQRKFLATIQSDETANRTGQYQYKSANTDVLAMVAEAATGRPMRSFLADIADAAGVEGNLHIATDREGFPNANGGVSVTARDLARYGLLFVRGGAGVGNEQVGSAAFIQKSLTGGVPVQAEGTGLKYSNHLYTDGRWVGHYGYGGQRLQVDLTSGVVGVFFSVLENSSANDEGYHASISDMLTEIGLLDFEA